MRRTITAGIIGMILGTMILAGTACKRGDADNIDAAPSPAVSAKDTGKAAMAAGNDAEPQESNRDSDGEDTAADDTSATMAELPEISGTGATAPVFSVPSGCYDEEFMLHIDVPEGYTCYFTLDGSSPLDTGLGFVYEAAEGGIRIYDRKSEPNVVNAVPTALYDAANVRLNSDRKGFTTTSRNPGDDAIDKCTVVRAVLVDADGNTGAVTTGTYFVGTLGGHIEGIAESTAASKNAGMGDSLAVISITGNYDDFFGYENGIYVKGRLYDEAVADLVASKTKMDNETSRRVAANYNQKGREWERRVHIDFFEADENGLRLAFNQDCGIRIQGNYSRSDLQKGFRLFARSEYGAKNFKYPVFGETVKDSSGDILDKYKSLILRNGGNCAFTTKWSADYWAYLAQGMECATMASRPAVVYLNGEYWGLYVLEENYSQDYFADRYGVEKESVVLYKGDAESLALGYKLDLGELPDEDESEDFYFKDLLDFFRTHDSLEADEDYEEFCRMVDPESVRDYFAVETWINNKWDWPGKNWSMWRTVKADGSEDTDTEDNKYADGRWRFCFYDLEFGGVSGAGDAAVNTVKEDNYKKYGLLDKDTNNPAVLCFAYCMTNDRFRKSYYDRLNQLSKVIFMRTRAQSVLNSFSDIYAPLYDQFFRAFPGTGSRKNSVTGGYASKQCISDFLDQRYSHIDSMIDWCEKTIGQIR